MKQKIVLLFLGLLTGIASWAHDFEVDSIFYNITSTKNLTVCVTYKGSSYYEYKNEYSGDVVIPSTVAYDGKTYSVTSIKDYAFYYCSGIKSITIPESVTDMGDYTFGYCTGLKSIVIPESVTSIGDHTFEGCAGLPSITIPESVTSIGKWAFYCCRSLTSIAIPSNVTKIGTAVFSDCQALTTIEVDANNTKYDSRNDCNAIIETASNTLMSGCRSTIIPESVTSIADNAFYQIWYLTSAIIPEGVTSIGDKAFYVCERLETLSIPSSVTHIGSSAFYECKGLKTIKIDANNTTYDSRNDCNAIIETASNTIIVGCQNTVIPDDVTSISGYAFFYCEALTSITIPEGLTSIGEDAFEWCYGLTSINIPNSVTSIGSGAFYECKGITSPVTIPSSIGYEGADKNVFMGCKSVPYFVCLGKTPTKYPLVGETTTVYIPYETTTDYENTWGTNYNFIEMNTIVCAGGGSVYVNKIDETSLTIETRAMAECELISISVGGQTVYATDSLETTSDVSITQLANGVFKFTGLDISAEIDVVFTNNVTPVRTIDANDVKISVIGGKLVVSGAEEYEVYDIMGRKVQHTESMSKGFYIVKVGGKSWKIRL